MTHNELPVLILVHRHTGTVHVWPADSEFHLLFTVEENDILYGVHDLEDPGDDDHGPLMQSVAPFHHSFRYKRRGCSYRHGRKRRTYRDLN